MSERNCFRVAASSRQLKKLPKLRRHVSLACQKRALVQVNTRERGAMTFVFLIACNPLGTGRFSLMCQYQTHFYTIIFLFKNENLANRFLTRECTSITVLCASIRHIFYDLFFLITGRKLANEVCRKRVFPFQITVPFPVTLSNNTV